MVLIEREGDIVAPEIRKLAPIGIAAAALLLLRGPSSCRAPIVLSRDQIAVEEFPKDEFAADVKASREHFGHLFGWPLPGKGRLERRFRQKKLRRKTVAQHFDVPGPLGQTFDILVVKRVDAAGVKQQMPELVEQRENLPGLRRAVVDVDDRENVVIEAEARKALLAERIFENEDADAVTRAPAAPTKTRCGILCVSPAFVARRNSAR